MFHVSEFAKSSLWKKLAEISYAMYVLDSPLRTLYLGIRYQDFGNAVNDDPFLGGTYIWELPAFLVLEFAISWAITEIVNKVVQQIILCCKNGEEDVEMEEKEATNNEA